MSLCTTLGIVVTALASFSISSSSESQSHFELAAISVTDTDVHLSGNLSFKHSTLSLEGTSHLVLQEPLSAMFVGKQLASKYCLSVVNMNTYLYKLRTMCPIQFSTQHVYTPDNITDIDIHLTFINTSATAYNYTVNVSTIHQCPVYGNINVVPNEIYNATFHIPGDPIIIFHHISTQLTTVVLFCKCSSMDLESNCSGSSYSVFITTYPGKIFQIGIVLNDENSNPVYGVVRIDLGNSHWTLGQQQSPIQFPGETNCSMYNFSINSPQSTTDLMTFTMSSFIEYSIYAQVHMQDCPAGFMNIGGKCNCMPLLARYMVYTATLTLATSAFLCTRMAGLVS